MTDAHLNLIDGNWLPGDHLTGNRNPSDLSDLIGHHAAATAKDVARAAQGRHAVAFCTTVKTSCSFGG